MTHLVGLSPHHVLVLDLLQTSWKHGMMPVNELLRLFARHLDVSCIRNNDVVAAISCRTRPPHT